MGYFNIIDSLSDIKVNEGMVESIPKNKNKDIDNLVKALLASDIDFIPSKNINSYKSFYNRSSFSKNFVDNVIKWTSLKNKSNNGAKLYMICLGDGGDITDFDMGKIVTYSTRLMGDTVVVMETMFKRGSVYYNVKTDEFIDDKDKVVDIIFSYCSDILVKDLVKSGNGDAKSVLNKFNVLHSGHFSVITAESSIATSINLLLYADREILQEFYDDVCAKLPKTNYKVGLSSYGFIQFVIPF